MIWILEYFTKNHLTLKLSSRPIAGYANLCPNMISTQAQEFVGMLSTVKHEIIHALVRLDKTLPWNGCLLAHMPLACSQEKDVWWREALALPPSICVNCLGVLYLQCISGGCGDSFMVFDFVNECLTKGFYVLVFWFEGILCWTVCILSWWWWKTFDTKICRWTSSF